jgi:hypothetical protein
MVSAAAAMRAYPGPGTWPFPSGPLGVNEWGVEALRDSGPAPGITIQIGHYIIVPTLLPAVGACTLSVIVL